MRLVAVSALAVTITMLLCVDPSPALALADESPSVAEPVVGKQPLFSTAGTVGGGPLGQPPKLRPRDPKMPDPECIAIYIPGYDVKDEIASRN